MRDKSYSQLVRKMKDVSAISPQKVGFLTPLYRMVIPLFKRDPWRPLLLSSMFLSAFLYIVLGASIVWIVSILQSGF